jgi:hypothetical protein
MAGQLQHDSANHITVTFGPTMCTISAPRD